MGEAVNFEYLGAEPRGRAKTRKSFRVIIRTLVKCFEE